jgi:DNA-binding transcriptional regulator YdaS (Cro superfamily)
MSNAHEALERAVRAAGSQSALAEKLGVKQGHVWHWLNKSLKGAPAERVRAIESVTGIPAHELRPDVFQAPERANG